MIRFAALRTGLLMLLAGPLVADSTSSDPLPVHLLTGGGNALGFPLTTTLNSPAPGGHPAEQAGGAWFHDGSGWQVLSAAVDGSFGPEIAFARLLWDAGYRDFGIVKSAAASGGNSHWQKAGGSAWQNLLATATAAAATPPAGFDSLSFRSLLYAGPRSTTAAPSATSHAASPARFSARSSTPRADRARCSISMASVTYGAMPPPSSARFPVPAASPCCAGSGAKTTASCSTDRPTPAAPAPKSAVDRGRPVSRPPARASPGTSPNPPPPPPPPAGNAMSSSSRPARVTQASGEVPRFGAHVVLEIPITAESSETISLDGAHFILRDGTLVFPSQMRREDDGMVRMCFVFSRDHGETWHFGSVIPQTSPQTNENELLELDDGRLLFSTRTPSGSPTTVNPAAFCACVSCAERHPDRMPRGSFPCRRALPGTRPA